MSETRTSDSMPINHKLLVMGFGRGISTDGVLTPESKKNASYAAYLASIWNAPLLLTGNNPYGTSDYSVSEAAAMEAYICSGDPNVSASIPHISLDEEPTTTFENISGLLRLIEKGAIDPSLEEILLVAGEAHLRRIVRIARQCSMLGSISLTACPSHSVPKKEHIIEAGLTGIALLATTLVEPYSPERLDQAGGLYQQMIRIGKARLSHSGRRKAV